MIDGQLRRMLTGHWLTSMVLEEVGRVFSALGCAHVVQKRLMSGTLQPPKFASLMRSSSENPVILSGIFHGPAPRAHPSAGSPSGSAKSQGKKSTLHSSR